MGHQSNSSKKSKNNFFAGIDTSKKKSTPKINENKNKNKSKSTSGGKDKKEPQKIANIGNIGNTGSATNQKNINKIVQDMLRNDGRKTDLFGNELSYVSDLKNAGYSSKDIADMQKNAFLATSSNAKSAARKFLGKLGETLNTPVSQRGLSETALANLNSPTSGRKTDLFGNVSPNLGGRSFASSDLTNPFYMDNITRGFDQAGNKINIDPDVGKSFKIDRGSSGLAKYGMMAGVNAIAPGLGFAPAIFDKMFGSSDYIQRMQFFKEQGLTGDALKNATMASLQEPLGTGIENLEGFQSQLNQNKMLNKFDTNGFQDVFQDFNRDPQVTQTQEGNDGGGSGSDGAQQTIDSTNMITFFNPELGKYVTGTYQDYLPFVQAKDGGIIGLADGGPAEEMSVPDLNSFRPGEVMSNPGGMPYMDQETDEMLSSQDLKEDLDDVNRIMPDSGIAKLLGRFQKEADIASNTNDTRQFLTNGIGLFYNKNTRQSEVHDMSNPESKEMLMKGILEFEKEITSEQEMFPPTLEADYRNMEDFTIPKAPNRMSSEPGITSIPGADRVIEGTTMEDVNIPSDMRLGTETNDPMLRYPEDPNGNYNIPYNIADGGIIGLGDGGMSNPMDMQAMDDMMFKDPEDDQEWEYNV